MLAGSYINQSSSLLYLLPQTSRILATFSCTMSSIGTRWKGRGFSDIAQGNPMSEIIKQLQTCLVQRKTFGMLTGCDVLLEAERDLADLLNRACFGQPIVTSEKEKQWFQLGLEESYYLAHALNCLPIIGEDQIPKNDEEIWGYMKSNRIEFPFLYKAYAHLRSKNWIVRPGLQYGVNFVAYRHHPALVHSEYAVLVQNEDDSNTNHRLRVWSDWQCALRVSGGVAKTLLVISIDQNKCSMDCSSCLEQFRVEEHVITRWVPEVSREIMSGENEAWLDKCSSSDSQD